MCSYATNNKIFQIFYFLLEIITNNNILLNLLLLNINDIIFLLKCQKFSIVKIEAINFDEDILYLRFNILR